MKIYIYRYLTLGDMPQNVFDNEFDRIVGIVTQLTADGYGERLSRDLFGFFMQAQSDAEAALFKLKYT